MFTKRTRTLLLIACSLLWMAIGTEAVERKLLQTNPVCKPGTYSATGTNCKPCPPQAMCLRLPLPCEEMPACDPVTGKATSMCWVRKAAGSPCSPRFFGDQAVPEEEKTDVCSSDGQCWPKGTAAAGGTGALQQEPSQQQQQQLQQQGKPVFIPAGVGKCPLTPKCRRAPGSCDVAPPCDAKTGKPISMCWIPKQHGTPCNPDNSGSTQTSGNTGAQQQGDVRFDYRGNASHICLKQQCISSADLGVRKNLTNNNVKTSLQEECNIPPACTRIQGPCDLRPPCGPDGRPTALCYLSKPKGSPCTPRPPFINDVVPPPGSYVCNENQACVLDKAVPAAAQHSAAKGPAAAAAAKCPDVPMCRRMPGPCEKAPPCGTNGKAISMCWVPKPDGAQCKPDDAAAAAAAAAGGKYVCKNQRCVPV